MTRPLIGISCYVEPASWGAWRDVRAALVPQAYVDHVHRAGGRAVIVPPLSATAGLDEPDPTDLLTSLDGLIIAGGADLDPATYRQPPHSASQQSRPDRDSSELALVRAAVALDFPLLGICRGMQIMAVEAGGTLEQHLPDLVGDDLHAPAPGRYGAHPVELRAGSRLAALLGPRLTVPSHHHQAVAEHPGYRASGHAPDGTLEAMEHPRARFAVAVQWHPEVDEDNRLFAGLIEAARAG